MHHIRDLARRTLRCRTRPEDYRCSFPELWEPKQRAEAKSALPCSCFREPRCRPESICCGHACRLSVSCHAGGWQCRQRELSANSYSSTPNSCHHLSKHAALAHGRETTTVDSSGVRECDERTFPADLG